MFAKPGSVNGHLVASILALSNCRGGRREIGAFTVFSQDNVKDAIREYLAVIDENLKDADFREVEVAF